jgi:hypothetical protein
VLPCEPGRVCVDIINQACVPADVTLYVHDGYDLDGEYVTRTALECCENQNSTAPCPCDRPGFDVGEVQLRAPELFQAVNRVPIVAGGAELITTLDAQVGRVRRTFLCDELKSVGIEMGDEGDLPAAPEERSSVYYRCTIIEVDREDQDAEEHVACGGTIQFRIYDRNDCAHPDLTQYRVDVDVSQDCTDVQTTTQNQNTGN